MLEQIAHWLAKADSPEAIIETLGDMAQLFDNDIREMPNVYDFKD